MIFIKKFFFKENRNAELVNLETKNACTSLNPIYFFMCKLNINFTYLEKSWSLEKIL